MKVESWVEWWFVKRILSELANEEEVSSEEIEMCFREQFGVAEGVG